MEVHLQARVVMHSGAGNATLVRAWGRTWQLQYAIQTLLGEPGGMAQRREPVPPTAACKRRTAFAPAARRRCWP